MKYDPSELAKHLYDAFTDLDPNGFVIDEGETVFIEGHFDLTVVARRLIAALTGREVASPSSHQEGDEK